MTFRVVVAFLFVSVSYGIANAGPETSEEGDRCLGAVGLVQQHFGLGDVLTHSAQPQGDPILAMACKAWPNDKSRTIAAFVYDYGAEYEWKLIVALVTSKSVLATYEGKIYGDGITQWGGAGFSLDTARYNLSEKTRAFGLRVSADRSYCAYEAGSSDDFTLFIVDKSAIRPVLSGISLNRWCVEKGSICDGSAVTVEMESFVSIAPTVTKGFHDLVLTTKIIGSKVRMSEKLRYDGTTYPVDRYFNSCN